MKKYRFGMKSSTQIICILGFLFFFFGGIFLLFSNLLVALLSFGMSFAGLVAFVLGLDKSKNFIEINKTGILWVWSRGKMTISWDNIAEVGEYNFSYGKSRSKMLGINFKDKKPLEEAYTNPSSKFSSVLGLSLVDFQKNFSGWDVTIPDTFDLKKIEPLVMKYWKNPELRKELE